jgi:hypothetical protein
MGQLIFHKIGLLYENIIASVVVIHRRNNLAEGVVHFVLNNVTGRTDLAHDFLLTVVDFLVRALMLLRIEHNTSHHVI